MSATSRMPGAALAVTLLNLRTLPTRAGAAGVVVLGVAAVVFVLTALLAMVQGVEGALRSTGDPGRLLMLGRGAHSEINGAITREQAAIVANLPGIAHAPAHTHGEAGANGRTLALASPEIYATANLPRSGGGRAGLPLRGVTAQAFAVRPEVHIVSGRGIEPGRFELLVGRGAARTFAGLEVGDSIAIKGATFRVVGQFDSGGRATESEAWMDLDVMASVFARGPYLQSILVRLDAEPTNHDARARLDEAVGAERRLALSLFDEARFHAAQADDTTRAMRAVTVLAGIVMTLGAVFAALNGLYTAVAAREREWAILRALGFDGATVVLAVLVEALLLATLGGLAGAMLGTWLFDGLAMASTGATYTQLAFRFTVTPAAIATGLAVAVLVGVTGGLPPALAAARRSVVAGLRA